MDAPLALAPRILFALLIPIEIFFFGAFFLGITKARRRHRTASRATLVTLEPTNTAPAPKPHPNDDLRHYKAEHIRFRMKTILASTPRQPLR